MKIIFTRSSLILSRIIRFLSGEPVSHMAIVFDDKLLFQSNLLGVKLSWFATFKRHSEIVYTLDYDLGLLDQEQIYQSIITNFDGKDYDYGAFLYFMWRGILLKLFKTPLPKRNAWGSPDRYLCDELVHVLPEPLRIDSDVDLMTPYQVYLELKRRKDGQENGAPTQGN